MFSETWLEKKDWRKVERNLPKGYIWRAQRTSRKSKKGKVIGGMVMGIRKEIAEKGIKMGTGKEGFMVERVKMEGERLKIVEVYIRENRKSIKGNGAVNGGQ